MGQRNQLRRYWIVSFLIAAVLWIASAGGPLSVVPGLIFLGWGSAVASNWRGAADAMPTTTGIGPFRQTLTPAFIRLIFGMFALFGALILSSGLAALGR